MISTHLLRGCAVALALATASPILAATFTVDLATDAVDAVPGDGVCAALGGGCTLRAAIQEANQSAGGDTVSVPAGTYVLAIDGTGEDDGATGDLDVADAVVIEGASAAATIIDGGAIDRVLDLGADTTLRRLTIRNGNAGVENGGGIRSTPLAVPSMSVLLEDVVLRGNDALNGGGLANEALSALVVRRSTFTDNAASVAGGALINAADSNDVMLENVTVSANFDGIQADGMRNEGVLDATHVTVVDDRISGDGITLTASLLDNGASGSCAGVTPPTSGGGNLEHGTSCALAGAGDQSGVDPMALPLGDWGGQTPTHAIPVASPAVDALTTCPLAEDQRGISRPQDGDSSGGAACDVGAFETEPGFVPTTTTTVSTTTTTTTLPFCTMAPTFESTACRIESLQITFTSVAEPIKLATKLSNLLVKAGDRLPIAEEAIGLGKVKKAKRQVGKSGKLVRKFAKKLEGRKGPKVLADDVVRSMLASDATTLQTDLVTLKDSLQ